MIQLEPQVTIAVPSLNQGRFLDAALQSIFSQPVAMEVMLADAGSTDETQAVIERWRNRLVWFRSAPDRGQSAAINEAISRGRAPFICWLCSDDLFLSGGLSTLVDAIEAGASGGVVYGGCLLIDARGRRIGRYRSSVFSARRLSQRCFIAQPAAIICREEWERVGGLDESLDFALDYDLWWRLHHAGTRFEQIDVDVAAARLHLDAKCFVSAGAMYEEAKSVVRRHTGSVPLRWRIRQPISVGVRTAARTIGLLARSLR